MKFDFVIGNPPYQDDTENKGDRSNPVYDKFMDSAFGVADVVELIHPARFLFNAGQTPKKWNEKMLSDEHFKVLHYEPNADVIFQNTEIKGGIAITLRNEKENFGSIETFTKYNELNHIVRKINQKLGKALRLDSIIASQGLYKFTDLFFEENPEAPSLMGKGTGSKIVSKIMSKMPEVFMEDDVHSDENIRFLGRVNKQRIWKRIRRDYVIDNKYIDTYNLLIPEANNSGEYGEKLTEPAFANPGEGAADTFLSAGTFATREEAENFAVYMKTKFFRALLGVRKVTQHCPPAVWRTIPLQDFTDNSDIDWTQSVANIDLQLYKKYGLTQEEIDFIETNVKEMD